MDNRLIFLYHRGGDKDLKGRRRRVGQPGVGFRFKPVGASGSQIPRPLQRLEAIPSHSLWSREVIDPMLPRKSSGGAVEVTVPQTDSGGRVENTKALERTVVKELCKLAP